MRGAVWWSMPLNGDCAEIPGPIQCFHRCYSRYKLIMHSLSKGAKDCRFGEEWPAHVMNLLILYALSCNNLNKQLPQPHILEK